MVFSISRVFPEPMAPIILKAVTPKWSSLLRVFLAISALTSRISILTWISSVVCIDIDLFLIAYLVKASHFGSKCKFGYNSGKYLYVVNPIYGIKRNLSFLSYPKFFLVPPPFLESLLVSSIV
jgi:hypothetical protein